MKKLQLIFIVVALVFSGYLYLISHSKTELVSRINSSEYIKKFGKQASGEAWKDCFESIKSASKNNFVGPEIPKIITTDSEFICYKNVL